MAAAADFLSPEWFDALAGALASVTASDEPPFALGQVVTGVPSSGGGEVSYTIHLGGGQAASLERGTVASADAVLLATYADARALATGETAASTLIASGRMKIRGEASRLVEVVALLQKAAGATGELHRIVTSVAHPSLGSRG